MVATHQYFIADLLLEVCFNKIPLSATLLSVLSASYSVGNDHSTSPFHNTFLVLNK